MQDDITRRIAGTLASRLTNLELAKAATKPPSSLEAYDLVLRGRDLYARVNRSANSQARVLFKRAIELDPSYAPAYIGLGRVELNGVMKGWTADPEAAMQRAEKSRPEGYRPRSGERGRACAARRHLHSLRRLRSRARRNAARGQAQQQRSRCLCRAGDGAAVVRRRRCIGQGFRDGRQARPQFHRKRVVHRSALPICSRGRNADAIRTLERSLDRNKTDPYIECDTWRRPMPRPADKTTPPGKLARCETIDPRFDSADFGSLLRKPELRAKLAAALTRRVCSLALSCSGCAAQLRPNSRWPFRQFRPAAAGISAPRSCRKTRRACRW